MSQPTDKEFILNPELWPYEWVLPVKSRENKYGCITPANLLRVIHTNIFDFDIDAPATIYASIDDLLTDWIVD